MNKEIVQYIQDAKAHGLPEQEIKQNLLDAGWDAAVVEESLGFATAQDLKTGPSPALKEHPAIVQQPQSEIKPDAKPIIQPATQPVQQSQPQQQPGQPVQTQNLSPLSQIMSPAVNSQTQTAAAPASALSDGQFNGQPKSSKKGLMAILGVLLLLILGGGGYYAYAYVYNAPQKVWDKFYAQYNPTIFKSTFDVKYTDPNTLDDKDNKDLFGDFQIKNLFLELKGDSFTNITDKSSPIEDSTFSYSFGSGNTNVGTGLGLRSIGKDVYVKVGDNPFLSNAISSIAQKKYDWVKINVQQLQDQVKQEMSTSSPDTSAQVAELTEKIKAAFENKNYVRLDKVVGTETINGVPTIHFKNTLDKQALTQSFNIAVDAIVDMAKKQNPADVKDEDVQAAHTAVNEIIGKLQVKEFDTWVGKSDLKLYRVHLITNAPSFVSLIKAGKDLDSSTTDDAKRVSDMRQMGNALELYYNDYGGYPEGNNGKPVGLTPNYIAQIPTILTPPGPGCNDFYNNYWYTPAGTKSTVKGKTVYSSYEYTFCLGKDTSGYKAGIAKIEPSGIKDNIECPNKNHCPTPDTSGGQDNPSQRVKDFVSKVDYSAEFRLDMDYSDYGKDQKVEAPSEFWDINKFIEDSKNGGGIPMF